MLAQHILNGRIEEATNIVNGADVTTVSVADIDDDYVAENSRVIAQILRIKKAQPGKRKMVTKEHGGKMMKLEHPYDRLILCR